MLCAGAIVLLAGSLIFGVPLTLMLQNWQKESLVVYVYAGGLTGLLLPCLTLILAGSVTGFGMVIVMLGCVAGSITAARWGRWRGKATMDELDDSGPPLRPRSKPEKWTH